MPDFSKREIKPELMDTEVAPYEELRGVLKELTRANELSFSYRPTLAFFKRLAREGRLPTNRPIVIIDAASGYGDMSRQVDRWAEEYGYSVEIFGVDKNPWASRAAAEATAPGRRLHWVTADLFNFHVEGGVDIVMSSLFAHHLPDPLLLRFIRWMEENARIGWFINDIERHPVPYYFLKAAFWATRRHRFMRYDGPVSFAAAFKKWDWTRTLEEAGLPNGAASIESWAPYRLCVSRVKPAA